MHLRLSERIVQYDRIWKCTICYQVFHLNCIKKWVNSSFEKLEEGWPLISIFAFAAKRILNGTQSDTYRIPHSCGEQCLKRRRQNDCPHPCTVLCHPGQCPHRGIYVNRHFFCGFTTQQTRCSDG